jgi:hypothetical protein
MKTLDYCKSADGEDIKNGDIVWCITTPYKILKIVSRKEYEKIERERLASMHEKRKEEYRSHFAEHKEFVRNWKERTGQDYPGGGWINARGFDDFEDYWKTSLERMKKMGPVEFPKNKIPMLYLAAFKNENSMEAYGFWQEATYVFKDPTKIPCIN